MTILSSKKKGFVFLFLCCSMIHLMQAMSFKDCAILSLPSLALSTVACINEFQPQLVSYLQDINFVTHAPHPVLQIGTALLSLGISGFCLKKKIDWLNVKNPDLFQRKKQKDVVPMLFVAAFLEMLWISSISVDALSHQKKLTDYNMYYTTVYNFLNISLPLFYVYLRPVTVLT